MAVSAAETSSVGRNEKSARKRPRSEEDDVQELDEFVDLKKLNGSAAEFKMPDKISDKFSGDLKDLAALLESDDDEVESVIEEERLNKFMKLLETEIFGCTEETEQNEVPQNVAKDEGESNQFILSWSSHDLDLVQIEGEFDEFRRTEDDNVGLSSWPVFTWESHPSSSLNQGIPCFPTQRVLP